MHLKKDRSGQWFLNDLRSPENTSSMAIGHYVIPPLRLSPQPHFWCQKTNFTSHWTLNVFFLFTVFFILYFVLDLYGLIAHIMYINSFLSHSLLPATAGMGLSATVRRCGGGTSKTDGFTVGSSAAPQSEQLHNVRTLLWGCPQSCAWNCESQAESTCWSERRATCIVIQKNILEVLFAKNK